MMVGLELTNHNAAQNQYRRTMVAFLKDGVPGSQFIGSQDGYLNITLDCTFTPTLAQSYDYAKLAVGSDDPDEPVVEIALNGAGRS